MLKNICLLGSTGYIGINSLRVIEGNPDRYRIIALGAGKNIDLLIDQIERFKPRFVAVLNLDLANTLKKRLKDNKEKVEIFHGADGYVKIATLPEVDLTIAAMIGTAGLLPTYAAAHAGKDLALANKEALVMAGSLLINESRKHEANIFPVDSEHSAIQQSIQGHYKEDLKKIILTGSGGPFRDYSIEKLSDVTPQQALKHPNWKMGKKITIDSATLMNKGLEAIEAKWLFDVDITQIEILIHPQSIIHSMVEYQDGSVIAQLAPTDMRIPISYALSYPRHLSGSIPALDFASIKRLNFDKPDKTKFKCLELALMAGMTGESMSIVLNGANEIAVQGFLEGKIGFLEIAELIEKTMDNHKPVSISHIEEVIEIDRWAQLTAKSYLQKMVKS